MNELDLREHKPTKKMRRTFISIWQRTHSQSTLFSYFYYFDVKTFYEHLIYTPGKGNAIHFIDCWCKFWTNRKSLWLQINWSFRWECVRVSFCGFSFSVLVLISIRKQAIDNHDTLHAKPINYLTFHFFFHWYSVVCVIISKWYAYNECLRRTVLMMTIIFADVCV